MVNTHAYCTHFIIDRSINVSLWTVCLLGKARSEHGVLWTGSLSSAEVSMSFTWRLLYRTAVWKTRRRRRGKQEAKPLPEVGRESAKLDEKVLELE